jgi:hypothetical protein
MRKVPYKTHGNLPILHWGIRIELDRSMQKRIGPDRSKYHKTSLSRKPFAVHPERAVEDKTRTLGATPEPDSGALL